MKTIVVCFLFTIQLVSLSNQAPSKSAKNYKCPENALEQVDEALKKFNIFSPKRKFPETITDLKEACRINSEMMKMLEDLALKCLSGFNKNVVQVTLYSIKRTQKSLCRKKPNKEMNQFVEAGKCVNSGRDQFRKCAHKGLDRIAGVKLAPNNMKIPMICCEVVHIKQCLLGEAKKIKECKDEHVDTLQRHFQSVATNTINIACADYNEDSDRCDNIHPPEVKRDKNKSLTSFFLELAESFPDDIVPPS